MKNQRFRTFPGPFSLVLILSLLVLGFGVGLGMENGVSLDQGVGQFLFYWKDGFFGMLAFTLQMIMILVFGFALAIARPTHYFLKKIANLPQNLFQAIIFVASLTMVAGLLNWGFGLISGALLARFVHLALLEKHRSSHPVLLAAAGYLGMAVWHGGLSGSAPLKVAESQHFLVDQIGQISVTETIFSLENFMISGGLVLVFLLTLAGLYLTRSSKTTLTEGKLLQPVPVGSLYQTGFWIGGGMLLLAGLGILRSEAPGLSLINLDEINFLLFAITLLVYRDMAYFTKAIGEGLQVSASILIQFPFYAGIMGMMSSSGLLDEVSGYLLSLATTEEAMGVLILSSAATVNMFIPSGGGQWVAQGPLILELSQAMGMETARSILLFSYGDQISNLLQPFWALPLLAITGVRPSELIRYTVWLFLAGFLFLIGMAFLLF